MTTTNQLKKGDKVHTVNGTIEEVMYNNDGFIKTYENPNNYYHPSKVWAVK